jgi:hypothetical protein
VWKNIEISKTFRGILKEDYAVYTAATHKFSKKKEKEKQI